MNAQTVYIRKATDSGKFEIVQYHGDKVLLVLDNVMNADLQCSAVDLIQADRKRRR